MTWFIFAAALIGAYLIGSINMAVIISKFIAHDDIRDHGSGNAGMTNMMRVMGFVPGLITFLFDDFKGAVTCLLARFLVFPYLFEQTGYEAFHPEYGAYYCAALCIIGHAFPVFFGFRGGKGVATTLGILLACQWQTGVVGLGVFLLVMAISGIVSLSSICAGISLPFLNYIFADDFEPYAKLIQALLIAVISVMIIIMHRANIVRLIKGEEKKLTIRKSKGDGKQ
jgi:glycerol-3-phosphate acyltransferase PlsY